VIHFYALLVTCSLLHESTEPACNKFWIPEPYRTLDDCLIAVSRADQGLRIVRSSLTSGTCTTDAPPTSEDH
jgi:hypothetical protein